MSTDVDVTLGENPFAEALAEGPPAPIGLLPWTEGLSPFAEVTLAGEGVDEAASLFAEALDALEVDGFDEAVADLVAETSGVVADRFQGETAGSIGERERLGDAHLAPLRLEAERYVDSLAEQLAGVDVASLSDEQFDAMLDRLDPVAGPLSPASEQLFGSIVKKVRSAAGFVVNAAKGAASAVGKVAGGLLTAALEKLRGLIPKLLQRVLSMAIGRLPAPLQAPARALAARFRFEGEDESDAETDAFAAVDEFDEEGMHGFSPAVATDTNELAAQFDEALADIVATTREDEQPEAFGGEPERLVESAELEQLAEARDALVSIIAEAQDGEDLAPAIENFVPALLPALKVGINLAGRQRVVGFLAKYLGGLIRGYVGPNLSRPLATAIVDTGLRLVSLEAEAEAEGAGGRGESEAETAATALAATVEDAVRKLAENEDYVFENDELLQLAAAEAFEQAVATNFPARLVKPRLQQAPSLGGSFVTRRVRSPHPFRRYSRVPEVEVTEQVADALRTFGGATLGAELRAAGVVFPVRARLHVFEAVVGTTVPALAAADRRLARLGRGHAAWRNLHPLTPKAAGLLLREPRLGVPVPQRYLAHRARVAVGQRLYWLEPLGAGGAMASAAAVAGVTAAATPVTASPALAARQGGPRASRSRATIDLRAGTVRIAVYLSETESQAVAAEIRQGRGVPALLRAMSQGLRRLRFRAGDRSVVLRTAAPQREDLAARQLARMTPDVLAALRRRLGGWYLTMIAQWARTRAEEFTRAAADPADGTTVILNLTAVPGISLISAAVGGRLGAAELRSLTTGAAMRGTPSGTVTVVAGRRLR
ncbi:hypothetical protein ACFVAJ_03675 [Agromyces sp. NPDC057679]|uniref:hypothetical protein n=1 Tax=Agromyces sp. NPDC057679 TaxID=3346207 RepID=UPI00366F42AD